eukprot:evm.model.scf_617.3 EVM.evm.TU.scf_617.3   scf_617:19993-20295(-)
MLVLAELQSLGFRGLCIRQGGRLAEPPRDFINALPNSSPKAPISAMLPSYSALLTVVVGDCLQKILDFGAPIAQQWHCAMPLTTIDCQQPNSLSILLCCA